ncbi:Alt-like RNA polymerase ADP-ribosyltransferase [Acinetobacter phage Acj9]|uniref:Alt RNA polymerase ADP-ribosylase n=1 Tax=Acinetobacter phage Acj9 TaxID=760939 RepID=E5EPY8_9CAUD|nr:Alt-like RNA polymerase ADP-ribosyltransferase [Acinetobacter phage Acj9]ADG60104.1 Alt RNA polymerase ADP-ribosylase [Acinetobacter phage Acj9]
MTYDVDQILMTEAFDENSSYQLPVSVLNVKQKPFQTFAIQTPENIPIVVRFAGTLELGENVKPLKVSDKAMQIILFGLSEKGNLAELKNGLSDDPIAVINTILSLVKDKIKEQHLESVMFRFPAKKMKGRHAQIQRIIKVIARKRFPTFTTLDEINGVSPKHAYVVLYKKSTGLESKGLPAVSDRFTKVDTKVGEAFIDTESGKQVSKPEAIALEITSNSEAITDKSIMMKTKISRSAAITAQDAIMAPDSQVKRTAAAEKEYQTFIAEPPLHASEGEEDKNASNLLNVQLAKLSDEQERKLAESIERKYKDILDKTVGSTYDLPTEYQASLDLLTRSISSIFSNDVKPSQAYNTMKDIAAILVADPIMHSNPTARLFVLRQVGNMLNEAADTLTNRYGITDLHMDLAPEVRKSISSYCGQSFKDINNYLLGTRPKTASTTKHIENLDEAFAKGLTLPKGTILYRGHASSSAEINRAAKDKYFVFKNFVSTSLRPIIFSGGTFSGYGASTQVDASAVPSKSDTQEFVQTLEDDLGVRDDAGYMYSFVITGAEKIKVIVPGELSAYPEEGEVILPRGTILRINSMYANTVSPTTKSSVQILVEASIVPPDQLTEDTQVFDGDVLMETGEIKPVRGLFSTLYEAKKEVPYEAMELLAAITNQDLPEKFVL